jgi:uncharacterized protein (DUF2141 family)
LNIIVLALTTVILMGQCRTPTDEETADGGTPSEAGTDSIPELVEEGEVTVGSTKELKKIVPDKAKKQKPLTITITDLKSTTAPVIFSVYEDEATYLDPKAQLKTYRFVPKGKTLRMKLTDLPFGTYAIAFYQDMNDSGEIDKNALGIPKEPYAFSNDIRPKLSAPSFDDCKFEYSKKENSIKVRMGK